jgi:peptide deformylase
MELLFYPDPRLREVALSLPEVNAEVREKVRRMFEIMRAHKGAGLAATQVGWMRRVFVVEASTGPEGEQTPEMVLINPKIVSTSGTMKSEEGCLSIPGIVGVLNRFAHVVVEALDLDGKPIRVEGTKLMAAVLQHETDHLNGILFIEKLSPADRQRTKKPLRELEEKFRAAHA